MDAPNLLADYLYLWETTVVRQAVETARTSASSGGHSSSYWCQQRQLAARSASPGAWVTGASSVNLRHEALRRGPRGICKTLWRWKRSARSVAIGV